MESRDWYARINFMPPPYTSVQSFQGSEALAELRCTKCTESR